MINCDRSLELEEAHRLGKENIKDIIACGFDPEKTFIFSDFDYMGGEFYRNIIRLQRCAFLPAAVIWILLSQDRCLESLACRAVHQVVGGSSRH